jgi:hypothetical protein
MKQNLPSFKATVLMHSLEKWARKNFIAWLIGSYLPRNWGMWRRSWLRNCAASRVIGSIPDGFTGIFYWYNLSGRTMASNRNEYQEYFLGGKNYRCLGLTTLPPSCANCLETWWPHTPGTLWNCTPERGLPYPYPDKKLCVSDVFMGDLVRSVITLSGFWNMILLAS